MNTLHSLALLTALVASSAWAGATPDLATAGFEQLQRSLTAVGEPSADDDLHAANAALKVMTMYGGTPDQLHAISANVLRGSVSTCGNKTITETWGMKILLELGSSASPVFDRTTKGLHANWSTATAGFIAAAKPHVASGKAMGVFMGDEICCGGTPYNDLAKVAAALKAGLPAAWIYTNECSEMAKWPKLDASGNGGVPPGLDAVSVDFYDEHNTDGAAEVEKNKKFYNEEIFPRLRPHQQALFVPGIFASSPSHCTSQNVSCPLGPQAAQIVIKLDGFFKWAKTEKRIAGFNPWHYGNRTDPQFSGAYDQRLGAVSMPTVVAKLAEIGAYISKQPDGH